MGASCGSFWSKSRSSATVMPFTSAINTEVAEDAKSDQDLERAPGAVPLRTAAGRGGRDRYAVALAGDAAGDVTGNPSSCSTA